MKLHAIWLLLGLVLGVIYVLIARSTDHAREQRIFTVGLVVVALIYIGFALKAGKDQWLLVEASGLLIYSLFVFFSIRFSTLWLAIGWAAHVLWDLGLHLGGHGHAIVPQWYVVACVSFDLLVAAYILHRRSAWAK